MTKNECGHSYSAALHMLQPDKQRELALPNEPFPRSLTGVYVSLKPMDRALKKPESTGNASEWLVMMEGTTGAPTLDLDSLVGSNALTMDGCPLPLDASPL